MRSLDKRWVPRRWNDSRWKEELPPQFLGPGGVDLAKSVVEKGGDDDFAIGVLNDVEFMVCFFPWVILPV